MALHFLRLRRTLSSLSTLHRSLSAFPSIPAICTPALQSPLLHGPTSASWLSSQPFTLLVQSRLFRSTTLALLSSRSTFNSNSTEEIGPDTILFEGCDYNHWLFVMDFPKDPKPTPEQMIQTYEETCAKGLNIRQLFLFLSDTNAPTHPLQDFCRTNHWESLELGLKKC
ncbi:DAG protein, chloroplastic [Morella rubra]|uniref:DAG protein, chloroplastic n=1 Tax=Morella rubra TaxID=262757 RepID=A0A6A1V5A4_9ROSI|nr:DAG protein, chloroplastic [Morella rubra]